MLSKESRKIKCQLLFKLIENISINHNRKTSSPKIQFYKLKILYKVENDDLWLDSWKVENYSLKFSINHLISFSLCLVKSSINLSNPLILRTFSISWGHHNISSLTLLDKHDESSTDPIYIYRTKKHTTPRRLKNGGRRTSARNGTASASSDRSQRGNNVPHLRIRRKFMLEPRGSFWRRFIKVGAFLLATLSREIYDRSMLYNRCQNL